jgi:LmbE family N-acetylglucosaminyl deacetylase
MKDDFNRIFEDINKVLVFTAHPDDMDIMFGGTIARLFAQGKQVRLVVCTNGALGSKQNEIDLDTLAKIRNDEQINSAEKLGFDRKEVFFLDNFDCTLRADDNDFIERVVYHMRQFRPDFLLTHDPLTTIKIGYLEGKFYINHRDHRAVGGAVVNALMPMARDINFFPQHKIEGMDGIIVKKFMVDCVDNESARIDVSDFMSAKKAALEEHKSQLNYEQIENLLKRTEREPGKFYEYGRFYELAY